MDDLPVEERKQLLREAVKEALREWLNEQWADFGKWSFRGLVAAVFAAVAYLWLTSHGFKV